MFFNSCCNQGNQINYPFTSQYPANGTNGNVPFFSNCGCNRLNSPYIPGPAGPIGPQGPMGPMGPQGAQGPQGIQGPQGPAGATGATGPQGVAGTNGVDGAAAGFGTPTATATTLASGDPATVTVTATGPDTAKVFAFEFGIPQGPVGATGATGATGPQGPQGVAGADGEAAGFGTPTATVTQLPVGADPTVAVAASGPNTAQVFDFTFGVPAPVTNDAMYANSAGTQTVATATAIPLVQGAAPANTTLTTGIDSVTVPAGTYLVSFGASGTNATGTSIAVQLYANGVGVANETITDEAGAATSGNVSKTVLYTAASDTPLAIYNVSGQDVSFTNAYLTVVRIA